MNSIFTLLSAIFSDKKEKAVELPAGFETNAISFCFENLKSDGESVWDVQLRGPVSIAYTDTLTVLKIDKEGFIEKKIAVKVKFSKRVTTDDKLRQYDFIQNYINEKFNANVLVLGLEVSK